MRKLGIEHAEDKTLPALVGSRLLNTMILLDMIGALHLVFTAKRFLPVCRVRKPK